MIHHLEELSEKYDDSFGGEIAKLIALDKSNIDVAKTIVVSRDMFKCFSLQGTVDGKYIDQILSSIDEAAFLESPYLFMQTSLTATCNGIQNNLKAEKNYSSVKYQIEKIYRSWADEKAKAYRLTYSVSEDASMPAIFIQPYFSDMVSLVSRTSTTGEKTNEGNYNFSVHNKVPVFHQSYKSLLDQVELAIKSPSKIYLTVGTNKICKVKEQIMTDEATWHFLDEYLERGLISKLEYIMHIKPTMLSRSTGGIALTPDKNALATRGIPASPGIVGGKLVFRDAAPDKLKSQNYIFIAEETTPDDFEFIKGSSGAVQLRGGMTCHLAVICRGLAKPALVGLKNVRIDEKERVLYCSGQAIPEFTDILLDGSSGNVILSGDFFLQGGVRINENFKSRLESFNKLLSPLTDPDVFSRLPLEVQMHIANLKSHMRRVGLLT